MSRGLMFQGGVLLAVRCIGSVCHIQCMLLQCMSYTVYVITVYVIYSVCYTVYVITVYVIYSVCHTVYVIYRVPNRIQSSEMGNILF